MSGNKAYYFYQDQLGSTRGLLDGRAFTVTRAGSTYFDWGPAGGAPGPSAHVGTGWINAPRTTPGQVNSFVSGWSVTGGGTPHYLFSPLPGGLHFGANGVWGNVPSVSCPNAFGYELVFGTKQAGVSGTYALPLRFHFLIHW